MDIIAVLQAGFIGLYGEWHRSYHGLDKNPEAIEKVIRALLDVLPADRKMTIRYPRHKNLFAMRVSGRKEYQGITVKEANTMLPEFRIGFCDHGFMVGKNDAGTFAPRPSKDYDYMTQESLFVPMDGEFFWAWSKPNGVKKDDGLVAIKRLWEQHYTFFSYAHNNTRYEGDSAKTKFNARFSIDEWHSDIVKPGFLHKNHLPVSDGYFEGANGKYVPRSIFEYIRDHLGYRLELQSSKYPAVIQSGHKLSVTAELRNRGFAAPVNPRPVLLVLVGNDKVYKVAHSDVDVRKWYSCDPVNRDILAPSYTLAFDAASLPVIPPGNYKLGIWLPDPYKNIRYDARYAVRFANRDVSWWTGAGNKYGINIIGDITVK